MFDLDTWREIFQSMNKNKLRTVLSGFTVAFAVLLFTVLFGIFGGLSNTFEDSFKDDAENSIFIRSGRTTKPYKGLQAGRRVQFKNKDYDHVRTDYDNSIQYSTSRLFKNVEASFRGEKNNYTLLAVNPDHQYLEKTLIKEGRFINQNDINNNTKVVVIGRLVDEDLFVKTTAIGKYINLSGIQYKVIGIFIDDGGDDQERMLYMPITTAQQIYGSNDYIDQILVTYKPEMSVDNAISFGKVLEKNLKERFLVAPNDQRAVRVFNMAEQTRGARQFSGGLYVIGLIIGFGTLIAGIVGISNIMIFIVKERTKELGIRKALGAQPKSIVSMIIIESIVITAVAGFLGMILGVGILKWVAPILEENYFLKDPSISQSLVVTATIIIIIAGIFAGYMPAKKASKIKPIVALRND